MCYRIGDAVCLRKFDRNHIHENTHTFDKLEDFKKLWKIGYRIQRWCIEILYGQTRKNLSRSISGKVYSPVKKFIPSYLSSDDDNLMIEKHIE